MFPFQVIKNAIRPETEFQLSCDERKVNYLSEDFPISIFTQTYHHAARIQPPLA